VAKAQTKKLTIKPTQSARVLDGVPTLAKANAVQKYALQFAIPF
jgi:hypothetical protein